MKFSELYFPPQEYVTDSKKMRIRLGAYVHDLSFHYTVTNNSLLGRKIQQEVGILVPKYQVKDSVYNNFEAFFNAVSLTELLDSLTETYHALSDFTYDYNNRHNRPERGKQNDLIAFANRCFSQEGIAYFMNADAGIRFRPDQEFERNRILTLKGLEETEFQAVCEAYTRAYEEFQTDIKKSKSALRYIFEANEILFKKLAKPKESFDQLNEGNINKIKDYFINDNLDQAGKITSEKMLASYKDWVSGMHPYRHGQDVEKYNNPPIDLAILALSNGASYLRWLASIIQSRKK